MHPRGREALRDVAKVLRSCLRAFTALLFVGFTHGGVAPQTIWVRDLDDPDLIPRFSALRLILSPGSEGSVYFATEKDLTVGRFDADGNLLFKRKLVPFVTAFLSSRITDSTGNLILGGRFTG